MAQHPPPTYNVCEQNHIHIKRALVPIPTFSPRATASSNLMLTCNLLPSNLIYIWILAWKSYQPPPLPPLPHHFYLSFANWIGSCPYMKCIYRNRTVRTYSNLPKSNSELRHSRKQENITNPASSCFSEFVYRHVINKNYHLRFMQHLYIKWLEFFKSRLRTFNEIKITFLWRWYTWLVGVHFCWFFLLSSYEELCRFVAWRGVVTDVKIFVS